MIRTIARQSAKLVVTSQNAANVLQRRYGIHASKIRMIPHGVPDVPLVPTLPMKQRLGLQDRTIIMTSGLTGCDDGIESMLKALPDIVECIPDLLCIVLADTHLNQLNNRDRWYLNALELMAKRLGLERHVVFQTGFMDYEKLCDYLLATDIFVAPCPSQQHAANGELAYALGTGRAIVSAPNAYAQELLSGGAGKIVPFEDSASLADAIVGLHSNPEEHQRLRNRAYEKSRKMTWPVVGRAYWELICAVKGGRQILEFPPKPVEIQMQQLSRVS